jgi:hypothetical protein
MSFDCIIGANSLAGAEQRHAYSECFDKGIRLNAFVVTRIVYEIVKLYMMNNTAASVGVPLAQKYDVDYTKSDILLDIGYNWRTKDMSKVPAVYVQRGDVTLKYVSIGQQISTESKTGQQARNAWSTMPVTVSCVAAEPIAVVENLTEYIKQPLLYFRKEIQNDFGIRHFILDRITAPKLVAEGKNNFVVDLVMNITYDDSWTITPETLKIKRMGIDVYDNLCNYMQSVIA